MSSNRKKGKSPSLIGSSSGSVRFVEAKGKRTCVRNGIEIEKGFVCVEVSRPGKMGFKTYSCEAMAEIIEQTKKDLVKIEIENNQYLQSRTAAGLQLISQ